MNQDSKLLYAMFAVVLLVSLGGYFFPGSKIITEMVSGTASPAGSTLTNDFVGVTMNLTNVGANGTSSSILNTSSQDRYVTAIRGGCENLGTSNSLAGVATGFANLTLTVGTTSTANPSGAGTAVFYTPILTAYNLPTTTTSIVFSTSTETWSSLTTGALATTTGLWASGAYLSFVVNATNTANCTFGADYVGS